MMKSVVVVDDGRAHHVETSRAHFQHVAHAGLRCALAAPGDVVKPEGKDRFVADMQSAALNIDRLTVRLGFQAQAF